MEIIARKFQQWTRDRDKSKVFWEFLETERNLILKEYNLRFDFAPKLKDSSP